MQFTNFFSLEFVEIINDLSKRDMKEKYIANKYRYSQIDLISNPLFKNQFEKLNQVVGKNLKSIKLKKFSHRDFTLLDENENNQLILIHDLNDFEYDWGGYHFFQSYSEALFDVPIEKDNTSIIQKSSDMFYFVKYVNSFSNGSRIFLEVIYE